MTAGRREQLATALMAECAFRDPAAYWVADALLPVVVGLIRHAQATVLEEMAEILAKNHDLGPARRCRNRAAALRVSDDGRDVTQDAP